MEVVHALEDANPSSPSHVTVGAFDGVHRGHQHLIKSMARAAHGEGRTAVAVTFDPHPGALLGRRAVATLSTIEERAELLAELGLDLLAVLRFTAAVAGTSAARFVAALRRHLAMVELWAGPDFALGHRRQGDIHLLERLGEREGFVLRTVKPQHWEGKAVSSSRIRAALTAGDIKAANACLGRPYGLTGPVVRGRGLGHTLGTPTANLKPPPGRLIPANGVYVGWANIEGDEVWPAVINVGVRPTIAADDLTVEAHLLDFDGELHGQRLRLDFLARLRDEKSFPSLNALVAQVKKDIAEARRVLAASAAADSLPDASEAHAGSADN